MKMSCPSSTPTLKKKQRERHRVRGYADLGERARKAETVQQTERERDDPRHALGQTRGARRARIRAAASELRREKQDAQRDHGLDRRGRHTHETERRRTQRDAVREREGRDGRDELAHAAHEQQQREHEQQVIDAEQDVLDTEHGVRPDHFRAARPLGNHDAWRVGREPMVRRCAVAVVDTQEHVRLRER